MLVLKWSIEDNMSTRANIKVKDSYDTLWFYRHSDGYPEGAIPTIDKFMQLVAQVKQVVG